MIKRLVCFSAVSLLAAGGAHAALINGNFSSDGTGQYTLINDTTTNFTNHIAVDAGWGAAARGNRGYGWERTDDGGGNFIASFTGADASPLLQAFTDNDATTGKQTLKFDVAFTAATTDTGGRKTNLRVYVYGWNTGDTSPRLDSGNGEISQSDTLDNVNDGVSLITTTGTDSEGGLNIITQGVSDNGYALAADGSFQSVSIDLDFVTGYDFVGVILYGELPDTGDADSLEIDNVQIIPEPASLALIGLGGLLMLGRGRRA